MKLEQGDIFEFTNAAWLREHLPHYEQIWAAFIGHDGTGWPCNMPGLDPAEETARKRFYQAHYSFAGTMRKLVKLTDDINRTSGLVNDYAAFEVECDRLFRYASYLGHVRDMFKIMEEALACRAQLYAPLQNFYAQRSHVLHGPRLPVRIVDGFLQIPKVGGENKVFGEWDDKSTWDSVSVDGFVYSRDFFADTTNAFFTLVRSLHGKVFDAADTRFAGRRIAAPSPEASQHLAALSASIFAPAASGYALPSGRLRG